MTSNSELPKYRCHKEVWAFKIEEIVYNEDSNNDDMIVFGVNSEAVDVDREYMHKHKPQEGGYFVLYKGGYRSYSPADAFESGYSLIEKAPAVSRPTAPTDIELLKTATEMLGLYEGLLMSGEYGGGDNPHYLRAVEMVDRWRAVISRSAE